MRTVKYYHLEWNHSEELPLDFTSLENAYEFLAGAMQIPTLESLRKMIKEHGGQAKLKLGRFGDLCISEQEQHFADLSEEAPVAPAATAPEDIYLLPRVELFQPSSDNMVAVPARELFSSETWTQNDMVIPLMLGKNRDGRPVAIDLAKAPHLLVAGATGSGKSVTMNMMIQSMLMRFTPNELKLVLFDPKFLEFAMYRNLPHLLAPVIHDPEQVGNVLHWASGEMNRRYRLLATAGAKTLQVFNSRPNSKEELLTEQGEKVPRFLPRIVIVIDELADIMELSRKEVEHDLGILAAKSRAVGIHLIVATQRPDSKIITGVVKANFPTRIALNTHSRRSSAASSQLPYAHSA